MRLVTTLQCIKATQFRSLRRIKAVQRELNRKYEENSLNSNTWESFVPKIPKLFDLYNELEYTTVAKLSPY